MAEPTDDELLAAIMDAVTPAQIAARIFDYYHGDQARAERTSRAQMYLHMGMLCGAILRAIEDAQRAAKGASK